MTTSADHGDRTLAELMRGLGTRARAAARELSRATTA